ncbi:HNH endonuclease [Enterobacter hormaechei]|uniref:HNH endonuclease n=1 Tax=Enterobacter hormaechei TaxID=158836 RepID=UPI0036039AAA
MADPKVITTAEVTLLKTHLAYYPDTGEFVWLRRSSPRAAAGDIAGTEDARGYKKVMLRRKAYMLHRLAFVFMGQPVPDEIDHVNTIKGDNRWQNLRPCTRSQNTGNQNVRGDNQYGVKGLLRNKKSGSWYGQVVIARKTYRTPKLKSRNLAEYCLRELQRSLFGEFYRN